MEDSLSRWIMCLVPIFKLQTHNQTNNKCLLKFVQTDNVSSSIKMAIDVYVACDVVLLLLLMMMMMMMMVVVVTTMMAS